MNWCPPPGAWVQGRRRGPGPQWCSGKAAPALGSDLLHWFLLHVLRIPDKRQHRLLAHPPEVVGPQGQGLGVHTAGSQALGLDAAS